MYRIIFANTDERQEAILGPPLMGPQAGILGITDETLFHILMTLLSHNTHPLTHAEPSIAKGADAGGTDKTDSLNVAIQGKRTEFSVGLRKPN